MQFSTFSIIAFAATLGAAAPLTPSTTSLMTRAASIPEACHFVNDDATTHELVCTYATAPIIDANFEGTCTTSSTGDIDCRLPEGAKDVSIASPLAARTVEQEAYTLHISWKRDAEAVVARAVEQEAYTLHISWKRDAAQMMERTVEQEAYILHISW